MQMPLVRFGGGDRPIGPWEERLAPVILVFVIAAAVLMAAAGLALFLGWAAVSPVLPRSWRLNWDTAFDLNPSVRADCPVCRARLALGPVDKQGEVMRTSEGDEVIMPAQTATCPNCGRGFSRFSCGKVWSPWRET